MDTDQSTAVKVRRYFDRSAERFEGLYTSDRFLQRGFNRLFRAGLFDRLRIAIDEIRSLGRPSVLDVGCGPGVTTIDFFKAGASEAVGIDLADEMIALAKRNVAAEELPSSKIIFTRGDIFEVDLGRTYDAVVALGVFDYEEDPVGLVKRMAELGRKRIIASFPLVCTLRMWSRKIRYAMKGCPLFFYTTDDVRRIFEKAGLTRYRFVRCRSAGVVVVAEQGE